MRDKHSVTHVDSGRKSRFCTILLILCLFIGSIVIIVFVTRANLRKVSEPEFCKSPECIRSAWDISSIMDTSIDPCEDFLNFTCGHFTNKYKNRKSDAILKFLKSKDSSDDPASIRKSRDMFRACMDQETKDELRYEPVYKYLSLLGLPATPRFFDTRSEDYYDIIEDYEFDWMKTDIAMNALLDVNLFFNCYVDLFDSSRRIIICDVPKQNIYALQGDINDNILDDTTKRAKYEFMKFGIQSLITDKLSIFFDEYEKKMLVDTINAVIKTDSLLEMTKDYLRNSSFDDYITIQIKDLQINTTKHLNDSQAISKYPCWKQYLKKMFLYSGILTDFKDEDEIFISKKHIDYYGVVAGIISYTEEVNLELWAWWKAVSTLLLYTTSEVKILEEKILESLNLKSTSKEVACSSTTNKYMSYAVNYGLTNKTVLNTFTRQAQKLFEEIKHVAAINIESFEWKDFILEKMENLAFDEDTLENFYSNITIKNDAHLDNLVQHIKYKKRMNLESLYFVNLESRIQEDINNLLTVLVNPVDLSYYNRGLEVFNYGILGSIIGHELIHVFRILGQFHKYNNSNLQSWNDTVQNISDTETCFLNHYYNFSTTENNEQINKQINLEEIIADNGGLRLAYSAYQNYKKSNGNQQKLKDLKVYTDDQLFFLSYTNVLCSVINTELSEDSCIDSPDRNRILTALINSEEFVEAFNCPRGSYMNPVRPKCKLW